MPSLKDLKNRIGSVTNTRKITSAMKMVAAAKLRRAQDAAEAGRPYAERMNAVIAGLAASVGDSDSAPRLLAGTGKDDVHLLVVMTAERGLCGGFNSSIAKLARAKALELSNNGKTVKMRLNDRGPFIAGRIIDVTPRAASKLGFKGDGLARVRVECLSVGDGRYKRKRRRGIPFVPFL